LIVILLHIFHHSVNVVRWLLTSFSSKSYFAHRAATNALIGRNFSTSHFHIFRNSLSHLIFPADIHHIRNWVFLELIQLPKSPIAYLCITQPQDKLVLLIIFAQTIALQPSRFDFFSLLQSSPLTFYSEFSSCNHSILATNNK